MKLEMVACTPEHWEFVRQLRTDPRCAPGFVQQGGITPAEQQAYMAAHWQEHQICLVDGKPVGYVGVIENDIRVCVHPDSQRRGYARFMIYEILARHPKAVAKIKRNNRASQKLFESCGFRPTFMVYER